MAITSKPDDKTPMPWAIRVLGLRLADKPDDDEPDPVAEIAATMQVEELKKREQRRAQERRRWRKRTGKPVD